MTTSLKGSWKAWTSVEERQALLSALEYACGIFELEEGGTWTGGNELQLIRDHIAWLREQPL